MFLLLNIWISVFVLGTYTNVRNWHLKMIITNLKFGLLVSDRFVSLLLYSSINSVIFLFVNLFDVFLQHSNTCHSILIQRMLNLQLGIIIFNGIYFTNYLVYKLSTFLLTVWSSMMIWMKEITDIHLTTGNNNNTYMSSPFFTIHMEDTHDLLIHIF